jgi:hypothetical protein
MLELGVHKGESLKVFASYFARGQVFGVDIRNHGIDLSSFKNATFDQLDQRDGEALNAFTDTHAPEGWDIIIDDASHYGSWSLLTFNALFPRLKAGGLYVVEDWATGYWDDWADGARYQELPVPVPQDHIPRRVPSHDAGMVGFVKKLVDEICNKPATTRSSFISYPARFDWMHINDTFAVLRKTDRTTG